MRTWARVRLATACGGCGAIVLTGAPMLLLTMPGLTTPKCRCAACAGEAPPELPPLADHPVRSPTPARPAFTKLGALTKTLPFDYKSAQSGEREPGEDDE